MRLDDLLRLSVRQVVRQRRRNLGVLLAIALGTAGFIVIITMGRDVRLKLNDDLELLGGATRIKAFFEDPEGKYQFTRQEWFRDSTVAAIRRMPNITRASLMASKGGRAESTRGNTQHYFRRGF